MRVSVKNLTIGVGSYLGVIAGGYWWALSEREDAKKKELGKLAEDVQGRPKAFSEAERLSVFGQGAGAYDKEIGTDETVMGLNILRWWLLGKARGAVLEVAGGTGRNLDYLVPGKGNIASLTIVDLCSAMVAQLEHKLKTRCVCALVCVSSGRVGTDGWVGLIQGATGALLIISWQVRPRTASIRCFIPPKPPTNLQSLPQEKSGRDLRRDGRAAADVREPELRHRGTLRCLCQSRTARSCFEFGCWARKASRRVDRLERPTHTTSPLN